MFKLMIITVLGASALAAQSKRPTKPFIPPEDYYTSEPVVAKDEGCAKDYAKALALSGLEQRKMLAELVSYQCVETMPFRYRVLIIEGKPFEVGNQRFPMVRVRLGTNPYVIPMGPAVVKEGWMLSSSLVATKPVDAQIKLTQAEKK